MKDKTITDKVREFHKHFNIPTNAEVEWEELGLRYRLMLEEFNECKLDFMSLANKKGYKEDLLKELCDLVYQTIGTAVTFGWDFDVAFNRVHKNNMEKEKGSSDGKVVKPKGHQPPDLTDCV